jgi:hypothetical protein
MKFIKSELDQLQNDLKSEGCDISILRRFGKVYHEFQTNPSRRPLSSFIIGQVDCPTGVTTMSVLLC